MANPRLLKMAGFHLPTTGRFWVPADNATWRLFADKKPLDTFHPHTSIRPHFAPSSLPVIAPGGELKHSVVTEGTITTQLKSYGSILTLDRASIINDSALGLLGQFATSLARKAASTVSDVVWTAILDNANSHYHANNSNLSDQALDLTALAGVIQKIREQTDASGGLIDITPVSLIVPAALEGVARQLINSTEVAHSSTGALGKGTANPLPELLLGVEPRIGGTWHTNSSDTKYFVMAAPQDTPVTVGFLGGNEAPTIETVPTPADVLGISVRGFHDVGASLGDPVASVMSTGTV